MLGEGSLDSTQEVKLPAKSLKVEKGDLLVLSVDPRDGNHSCDLIELVEGEHARWGDHFVSLAGTVRYRKDSEDSNETRSALKLPPLTTYAISASCKLTASPGVSLRPRK